MKTNWQGLWYQGEGTGLYKSKALGKNQILELLESNSKYTRFFVRHNPFWKEGRNTPRFQFKFSKQTGGDVLAEDVFENEKYEELYNDAARMLRHLLADLSYGDMDQVDFSIHEFLAHWGMH